MTQFIIRRLGFIAVVLVLVSIISFIIIQLPPGDWLSSYLSALRSQGAEINEAVIAGLKLQYGLDQPPVQQYFTWMKALLRRQPWFLFLVLRDPYVM